MTEDELEARRKQAAEMIQNYVKATLKLCKTEDDINLALIYFGTCCGQTLKEISPEQIREQLSNLP